ncbi:MAG: TetR/AcrR family transcriptional regulator [Eubacterium sp.]|nr:TetR/AcrR family transcriptional regulator [Eubacterium sp.]MCM1213159.1 TetR/AcrR family transcriptional regulator [Lachnospiraceae bacterium]MCM1239463.1 TetR/AcrR family transcriptional regulator [Lachnospiraceae bacterium]
MAKMTGLEDFQEIPPKVLRMYDAVIQLIEEGEDVSGIRVSTITDRAGIGKGTAYDYFDSKEDIIACAVVFHIQRAFRLLERELKKQESFEKQLSWLLDQMDRESGRKYCFIRMVHILTDNSEFSLLVRQKMMSRPFERYHPVNVFGNILKRGVERKEIRNDLPVEFMVYTIFSGLLTYMLGISTEECFHVSPAEMKPFVYRQIMQGLGEKNL